MSPMPPGIVAGAPAHHYAYTQYTPYNGNHPFPNGSGSYSSYIIYSHGQAPAPNGPGYYSSSYQPYSQGPAPVQPSASFSCENASENTNSQPSDSGSNSNYRSSDENYKSSTAPYPLSYLPGATPTEVQGIHLAWLCSSPTSVRIPYLKHRG